MRRCYQSLPTSELQHACAAAASHYHFLAVTNVYSSRDKSVQLVFVVAMSSDLFDSDDSIRQHAENPLRLDFYFLEAS